ncbi:MAG: zinc ribbon domain-containing protein [Dehalococcoidia bacterium]|nr:zinc ribbon domain-containing protein [Dehalococcoidia bacterium]
MPLYEYYCPKCNEKFEMLRSISRADEETSCPSGHPGSTRILSLVARPATGDEFGDLGDLGGFDGGSTGGCACGGACSCG